MSFVLRRDDGREADLGPTMEVLSAWAGMLRAIPEGEHGRFAELIDMVDRGEDEYTPEEARSLAGQARELAGSEGVAGWLAEAVAAFGGL